MTRKQAVRAANVFHLDNDAGCSEGAENLWSHMASDDSPVFEWGARNENNQICASILMSELATRKRQILPEFG